MLKLIGLQEVNYQIILIHNINMKRCMLICLSYACGWIGQREGVRLRIGSYEWNI
jgi:hypothetical protein